MYSLWSGCSLRPTVSPLAPAVLLSVVLAVHTFEVREFSALEHGMIMAVVLSASVEDEVVNLPFMPPS